MEAVLTDISVRPPVKRLNLFEKYLTIWVGLCMVAGVALGKWAPHLVPLFRDLEFGTDSHINLPIAVLIWLMIVPMTGMGLSHTRLGGGAGLGLMLPLLIAGDLLAVALCAARSWNVLAGHWPGIRRR